MPSENSISASPQPLPSLALTYCWLQHWEPGWDVFFVLLLVQNPPSRADLDLNAYSWVQCPLQAFGYKHGDIDLTWKQLCPVRSMLSEEGRDKETGALGEHQPAESTAKVKAAVRGKEGGGRAVEAKTVCKRGRIQWWEREAKGKMPFRLIWN